MSELFEGIEDKVAKRYSWRDFDHFKRNTDYIDGDFIKAVNDVIDLEKENAALREAWRELLLFAKEHDADKSLYVEASEFIKKMEELESTK